eukprot:m.833047 g.833047  ORF g.833047 m.833047 type:complete len:1376 (+) comp23441_c0_seq12:990-5117(+)
MADLPELPLDRTEHTSFGRFVRPNSISTALQNSSWDERSRYSPDVLLDNIVHATLLRLGNYDKLAPNTCAAIGRVLETPTAVVSAAAAKMSAAPDYCSTDDAVAVDSVFFTSPDKTFRDCLNSMDSVFLAISVAESKTNSEVCTLYRTRTVPSTVTVPCGTDGQLGVCLVGAKMPDGLLMPVIVPKAAVLHFEVRGIPAANASEQHVLGKGSLAVKRIKSASSGSAGKVETVALTSSGGSLKKSSLILHTPVVRKLDPHATLEQRRTVYRAVLHRMARHSFKQEIEQAFPVDGSDDASGDLFVRWSGTFTPEVTEIGDAVAAQMHLLPRERALDMLSVVGQLQLETGVATTRVRDVLDVAIGIQQKPNFLSNKTSVLDAADEQRMADAMNIFAVACMQRVTSPFNSFDPAMFGSKAQVDRDLNACVSILQRVYDSDLWNTYVARESDVQKTLLRNSGAPIMLAAQKYIDEHVMADVTNHGQPNTYSWTDLQIALTEEFGQKPFFSYKHDIELLLLEATQKRRVLTKDSKGRPKGPLHRKSQVISRLQELLNGPENTLSGIKKALEFEFGTKIVHRLRDDISNAIATELSARQGLKQRQKRRQLANDILMDLDEHVAMRYLQLRTRAAPAKKFEGSDIVALTKIANVIKLDIEMSVTVLNNAYNKIGRLDLTESVVDMYGKLFGGDLELLLHRWKPVNSGSDLASVLFDLYFAVRALVQPLVGRVRPEIRSEVPLFAYLQMFEPFIVYWLRLSQMHVRQAIVTSVRDDELVPITADELISTSVLDVFRVLVEMVQFFNDLNWADKASAQKKLLPTLIDTVASSVRYYATSMRSKALENKRAPQKPGFLVDDKLCCALNNIDEAVARFNYICTTIYRDHIPPGSALDERCSELFAAVKTELATAQGDIMHFVAVGLRPRIKSDVQYMLHSARLPLSDALTYVDTVLGPLLDDPEAMPAAHAVADDLAGPHNRKPSLLESFLPSVLVNMTQKPDVPLPTPAHDGYLCRNLIRISANIANAATVNKVIYFIWEQILHVMRIAMLTAKHPLPRVLRPPGSPYINKSIFGYDKPVPKRSLPVDYQQHYSEILAFAQEHFIMFFSDDGDGVPHDTLIHLAERVLAPVLTCADMPTADLIAHFLLRSSARHGAVIRRAEALARTGSTAVASDADTSDDALPSATGQVNGQKTTVVVDPLGLTRTTLVAPRMPRTDREMSVVIRTVYDHSLEMLCLSVVDVAGCDPARVTLYYKLRVLPRYKTSTYKHRSDQQTKPDKWMFRAPGITNAVAVQLRVHEKHPLKKQQDTVLGEVGPTASCGPHMRSMCFLHTRQHHLFSSMRSGGRQLHQSVYIAGAAEYRGTRVLDPRTDLPPHAAPAPALRSP